MANLSNYFLEFQQLKSRNFSPQKKPRISSKLLHSGWLTGFEPATRGTTNRYSNQLSYNHHFCLAVANIEQMFASAKEL